MGKRIVVAAVFSILIVASTYAQTKNFFKLVKNGTPQDIQSAINSGAKVNAQDKDGMTPLMVAAQNNLNPEVITTLLKAGANVNAQGPNGMTPLMFAAGGTTVAAAGGPAGYNPNTEMIAALLKAGAEVNAQIKDDPQFGALSPVTAMMLAAMANPNPGAITTLLKAGADINVQNKAGVTPLMIAAIWNPNAEVVTALLKAGANAKLKDSKGYTALDYANGLTNSGGLPLKLKSGNVAFPEGTEAYRRLQEASK